MKLFFVALLAAIVSFAWGFISWMVMSWHDTGMHDFKNEPAVAEVIKENATHGTGIYLLPYPQKAPSYADPAEQQKLQKGFETSSREGPYMYAIVRPGRHQFNMVANMGWSFGRSFLAALILGAMLSQTVMSFPGRLAWCAAAGVFAGLVCVLPQHIWFELPTREVIVGMADYFIEWLLAGVVLALFLGKELTDRDVS